MVFKPKTVSTRLIPQVRGEVEFCPSALERGVRSEQALKLAVAEMRLRDNLDLTTPSGKLMFHVIGAMAEFERALIQERVKAGLAQAKREGRRGGRPKRVWRPKTERRVRQLRNEGKSWKDIAQAMRIPVGTLHAKFR
jgi:DNA invertase Pin-like site-specific DNA recombinase